MAEYGIGRVPKDVDPDEATKIKLDALNRPHVAPPAKPRKMLTCKRCRQRGYVGEYPFSTYIGSGLCDDCL